MKVADAHQPQQDVAMEKRWKKFMQKRQQYAMSAGFTLMSTMMCSFMIFVTCGLLGLSEIALTRVLWPLFAMVTFSAWIIYTVWWMAVGLPTDFSPFIVQWFDFSQSWIKEKKLFESQQ